MKKDETNTAMDETIFINISKTESGLKLLKEILKDYINYDIDEVTIVNPDISGDEFISGNRIYLCVTSTDMKILVDINLVFNEDDLRSYRNDFYKMKKNKDSEYDDYVQINLKLMDNNKEIDESDKYFIKRNVSKLDDDDLDKIIRIIQDKFRDNFKYLVALYSTYEELDEHYKGDPIIDEFKNQLKKLTEDEKFKEWSKKIKNK